MKCPICGSDSNEILKSKMEKSKSTKSKKLVLKCRECGTVYKDIVKEKKPVDYRIIISEHEKSKKEFIKLFPEDLIQVGEILDANGTLVEVNSLETKRGSRATKSILEDIETIWASSIEIPARVGISIDFKGRILSKKVDMPRDYEFTVGDIVKMGKHIFQINSIKTIDSKIRKGSALASDIKRVYGRPVKVNHFNYDLTRKVV
ncbi:MAG: HVO_0476 family zinc finger protein [Methanobacteriaceae archaeon]|nr:HVO_0476 family zinc finger protein [Methanobacteriaceae archaeon]